MNIRTKVFLVAWVLGFLAGCSIALSARAAEKKLIRVAIVDSGLNIDDPKYKPVLCTTGHEDFTGDGIKDTNGHGTAVAGIFRRYKLTHPEVKFCLVILKYYGKNSENRMLASTQALLYIAKANPEIDIVNYSGGGAGFLQVEYAIIKNRPEIRFVVAAGNSGKELVKAKVIGLDYTGKLKHEVIKGSNYVEFYPASYSLPNITVVGNWEALNKTKDSSNYGNNVNTWEIGTNIVTDSIYPTAKHNSRDQEIGSSENKNFTGTSAATPFATLKVIEELSKDL